MHHRSRPTSRLRNRSVTTSLAITVSMLISLCAPFMIRRAKAASIARNRLGHSSSSAQYLPTPPPLRTSSPLPSPVPPPLPSPPPPGRPPGANLPNLDVMRTLQSVLPAVPQPHIPGQTAPTCDFGDCGCPECEPPAPNDPIYATPRTQPPNRTGEPGITLGSRNFNWSVPLVSLSGRSGLDLNLSLSYNSLVWVQESGMIKFNADQGFPGPGFRLGFPIVQQRFQNSDTGIWSYLLITPSGGRVELRQVGASNIYEAYDGSYTQLTYNGASGLIVRTTDGTQLTFTSNDANYVCTG
jgi:hypothetical protein